MSDSREVPRVQLEGKALLPAPLFLEWSCHCCPHRVSGVSECAVSAAMDAHAAYVNTVADRAVDPHFAELRIDRLIQS